MSTARYLFDACTLAGEIYVTGGFCTELKRSLSSVEKDTPSSDTWSSKAPLPSARSNHAAAAVGLAMYVLGGTCRGQTLTSVFKFESTHDAWSAVKPMPEARRNRAACAIESDIYVFGGRSGVESQTSIFKLATETTIWSTLQPMPFPCCYHSVSVLDDDQVYIVGAGIDGKCVLRYDTASGVWSTLGATLNSKQHRANSVIGGFPHVAGEVRNRSSVERYDVATDTWTAVASMLEGRNCGCAVNIRSVDSAEEQELFDSLIVRATRERM
jgi:N-acetylneuraminic acid mutarotase